LIFAKHPALHSLALVALIGMFSVIIITSTLYPFWFRLLITNRAKKGLSPITFRLFSIQYSAFYIMDWVDWYFQLSEASLLKIPKENTEYYQIILAKFLTSVLYSNPFVKKKVIENPN
jgi:hypothetical protein